MTHQSSVRVSGVASPPPHGARLLAFGIDLAGGLLIALTVGAAWPLGVVVFVAYHAILIWLTGQTVGKAVANLEVRRVDGEEFLRAPRALPWILGRSSLGYLIVDALGIGVLVALPKRNGARRCLHDWVFGSQVVLRGELSWALPRVRRRLLDFASRRQEASKAVDEDHQDSRRVAGLWHWLVTGALAVEKGIDLLQRLVTHVSGWFGGPSSTGISSTTLSTKVVVGVAFTSSAITVASVTAFSAWRAPAEASIEGRWGSVIVRETGPNDFEGVMSKDVTSDLNCVFEEGQVVWRFSGDSAVLEGSALWAHLTDGVCDGFEWGAATFELFDQGTPTEPADDVLRECTTNPRNDKKRCDNMLRS